MKTYVDKVIAGENINIDDCIAEWNNSKSKLELSEYLGFTQNEYSMWVMNPQFLPEIISLIKHNRNKYKQAYLDELNKYEDR